MKLHGESLNNNNYKITEQDYTYFRELIWKNALDLFEKRKTMTPNSIIKIQRKYINNFNIKGGNKSNKYITVDLLNTYFNSLNKPLAEQVFYNTVLKKVKSLK